MQNEAEKMTQATEVAIYARAGAGHSLEDQVCLTTAYAKEHGMRVTDMYLDFAGGGDPKRPGFQELLRDARERWLVDKPVLLIQPYALWAGPMVQPLAGPPVILKVHSIAEGGDYVFDTRTGFRPPG